MKLRDWSILVALPTTTDELDHRRSSSPPSDFCRQFGSHAGFEKFHGVPVRQVLKYLSDAGCNVRIQAGYDDWCRSLNESRAVVSLVAHWVPAEADSVELFDGLYEWRRLANAVPRGYGKIIDLTVCTPAPMVRYLNAVIPGLIRSKPNETSIILHWLALYQVMATRPKEDEFDFDVEMVEAMKQLVIN